MMMDHRMREIACDGRHIRPKANAGAAFVSVPARRSKRCLRPRLHQLAHDLRAICRRNPQGAHRTQIDRHRTLLLCAKQLFEQGVYRKRAINLNADNIRTLVNAWHVERLTAATIRNRLVYLRWLARKIGKPEIVGSDHAYGVDRRIK